MSEWVLSVNTLQFAADPLAADVCPRTPRFETFFEWPSSVVRRCERVVRGDRSCIGRGRGRISWQQLRRHSRHHLAGRRSPRDQVSWGRERGEERRGMRRGGMEGFSSDHANAIHPLLALTLKHYSYARSSKSSPLGPHSLIIQVSGCIMDLDPNDLTLARGCCKI